MKSDTGFEFTDPRDYLPLSLDQRQDKVFEMCPRARDLRAKLLAIGGARVIWHIRDDHIGEILDLGRQFAEPAKLVVNESRECHRNTALLFLHNQASPVTGYALSDDGYWRQHSWGWTGTEVLETTKSRVAYYGYTPAPLRFALSQLGSAEVQVFLTSSNQEIRDRLMGFFEKEFGD